MKESNLLSFFNFKKDPVRSLGDQIITKFKNHRRIILRTYFLVRNRETLELTATEEWMVDNHSLVFDTLKRLNSGLNYGFFQNLPLSQTEGKGFRIHDEITTFVNNTSSHITSHRLSHFITQLQEKEPLNIAELWALPVILKIILVEKYSQIVDKVEKIKSSSHSLDDPKSIRKIIISLQNINEINWVDFVEEHSLFEKILNKDPQGIYSKMDPRTRDSYRHSIEEVSTKTKTGEREIANWLIETSKEEQKHIGEFLFGNNRKILEDTFGYKRTSSQQLNYILREHPTFVYIGSQLLIATLIIFLILSHSTAFLGIVGFYKFFILGLLVLIPSLEVSIVITNFLVTKLIHPQMLHKMDAEYPLSLAQRTMVVIPTLVFPNLESVESLIAGLKNNYLTNQNSNVFFALLVAFPQTKHNEGELTPVEENFLNLLKSKVEELNTLYPSSNKRFLLFYRKRVWNADESVWGEWERKRGKILEFNQLLRGKSDTTYVWHNSDVLFLKTIKYVITIDQDVSILKDNTKNLIAIISHPLNQAKLIKDPISNNFKVVSGYGIIQPRLGIAGDDNTSYDLVRSLLGGSSGWDSYSFAQSHVYQDLFSEGFYLGKGIYDVDVFNKVLADNIPLNTLLSHDHIEGFYCRTAYASDIQIYEDFPKDYRSYRTRLERWIRGDWQRTPWLFKRVRNQNNQKILNPFKGFQKWKLLQDNIQSLFLPSLFVLLALSWFIYPELSFKPTIYVFGFLMLPSLLGLVSKFANFKNFQTFSFGLARIMETLKMAFINAAFYTIFLVDHFIFITAAIGRAWYRTVFSKKKRLQWTTFYETSKVGGENNFIAIIKKHLKTEAIIVVLIIGLILLGSEALIFAFPLLIIWAFAPFFEKKLNESVKIVSPIFDKQAENNLKIIARKTWRYFEHFATAENNFIPPDFYQPGPPAAISRMTSITNIGVYLMANFSTYDLGQMSLGNLLESFEKTFDSLDKLPRHKGHFFNWYDVKTLNALNPLYISTVDSGNLAASLISIRQGLLQLPELPIFRKENLSGLMTLVKILENELDSSEVGIKNTELNQFVEKVSERICELKKEETENLFRWNLFYRSLQELFREHLPYKVILQTEKEGNKYRELPYWINALEILIEKNINDLEKILPSASLSIPNLLANKEVSNVISELSNSLYKSESILSLDLTYSRVQNRLTEIFPLIKTKEERLELDEYIELAQTGAGYVKKILKRCEDLSDSADKYATEMDFGFLYNKKRSLFRIGYNLSKKRFDKSHYDLLASESRLASFIAIAKNDIPLKHWSALGRQLTIQKGKIALLSWGGSIFEYLFPLLVLPRISNSLLSESHEAIVEAHISYAKDRNMVWGISESSFALVNKDGVYGYKLHGIQDLSLKQYPNKDLVVSPYSSFLALEINPSAAYENIMKMQKLGATTNLGFYEALDFNKYGYKEGKSFFVKTFLSHHQGTILISIANVLTKANAKSRFLSDALMHNSQFLLEEKIPNTVEIFNKPSKSYRRLNLEERKEPSPRKIKKPVKNFEKVSSIPLMGILSDGDYSVFISNRGSGYSKFQSKLLTNWTNDPTLDTLGQFIFVKDLDTLYEWSATFQPTKISPENYEAHFTEKSIQFRRTDHNIEAELLIDILPGQNLEIRTLKLKNLSIHSRLLEIKGYSEVILADMYEHLSQPAWSKMRIETQITKNNQQLFHRQSSNTQSEIWFGHKVIINDQINTEVQNILNRKNFLLQSQDTFENLNPDAIAGSSLKIHLNAQETKTIYYIYGAATSFADITNLLEASSNPEDILLEYNLKREKSKISQAELLISQQILSCILYKRGRKLPKPVKTPFKMLEKLGIDRNIPYVLIETGLVPSPNTLSEILTPCHYLWKKGINFKLVILTSDKDNYYKPILEKINNIIEEYGLENYESKDLFKVAEEKIHILEIANITDAEHKLIHSAARAELDLSEGALGEQIDAEFRKI